MCWCWLSKCARPTRDKPAGSGDRFKLFLAVAHTAFPQQLLICFWGQADQPRVFPSVIRSLGGAFARLTQPASQPPKHPCAGCWVHDHSRWTTLQNTLAKLKISSCARSCTQRKQPKKKKSLFQWKQGEKAVNYHARFNQNVSKAEYLQETEKFPIPLQYLINHCKWVLSFLFHCHVCRNRWLDIEQRVPKTKWKSKMKGMLWKLTPELNF